MKGECTIRAEPKTDRAVANCGRQSGEQTIRTKVVSKREGSGPTTRDRAAALSEMNRIVVVQVSLNAGNGGGSCNSSGGSP